MAAWMVAGDPSAAGTHAEGESCHVFASRSCLSTCLHTRLPRLTLKLVTVGTRDPQRGGFELRWLPGHKLDPVELSWSSCS